jgi:dipeptidyl aminopeptidase/acylaminoacyl peptidase
MTRARFVLLAFAVGTFLPFAPAQPGPATKAHGALVHAVALSPDGKTLATAGFDNVVKLWSLAPDGTLKEIKALTGHTGPVYAVAFHPKEEGVLATASLDKTAKIWNVKDGKATQELKGHTDIVDSVAFSPDGKVLATGSADKSVRLWNPADGKETKNLGTHPGSVYAVVFSPDGKLLASAGGDNSSKTGKEHVVKLWDVAAMKEAKTLTGHELPVTAITFAGDAKTLVSGSMDRTLRFWDTATGKETKKLGPTPDDPYALAWSDKAKALGVCGYSGQLSVWPAGADKAAFTAAVKSPGYCVVFTPDGKALISGHDNGTVVVTKITAK